MTIRSAHFHLGKVHFAEGKVMNPYNLRHTPKEKQDWDDGWAEASREKVSRERL